MGEAAWTEGSGWGSNTRYRGNGNVSGKAGEWGGKILT